MADNEWDGFEEASDEVDDTGIQELLDEGYELLDEFLVFLEESLALDVRTAQQDCFNAEAFLDFLANSEAKRPTEANEFDLRWFVFSHYIRTAMADAETEKRLPDSLRRFYEYLRAERGYRVRDWVYAVLEDRSLYWQRWSAYKTLPAEKETEWLSGYREWCEDLENDMDARCLWMPKDMGEAMFWGDTMGWREAALRREANHLWQQNREELMALGLDFEEVRGRLADANYLWLDTPQARLEGETPRSVIEQERGIDER
jgi:hypothetical protein